MSLEDAVTDVTQGRTPLGTPIVRPDADPPVVITQLALAAIGGLPQHLVLGLQLGLMSDGGQVTAFHSPGLAMLSAIRAAVRSPEWAKGLLNRFDTHERTPSDLIETFEILARDVIESLPVAAAYGPEASND